MSDFTRQAVDDRPFLHYFHNETRVGFAWDGTSGWIEVNQGGIGEPIVTRIKAPTSEGVFPSLRRGIQLFQYACDLYVAEVLAAGLVNVEKTHGPYGDGDVFWGDDEVKKFMPKGWSTDAR